MRIRGGAGLFVLLMGVVAAGARPQMQAPGIPFWADGYITPHANPLDYTTRCSGASALECDRGTLAQDRFSTAGFISLAMSPLRVPF